MFAINPVNVSFKGYIKRQTSYFNPGYSSKDEFIRSYDDKINQIKEAKEFAIKVDDLIHNDPEIRKVIDELPEEDGIIIINGCHFTAKNEGEGIKLQRPWLQTEFEDGNDVLLNVEPDIYGNPDKEQIIGWLNEVKDLANNN